MSQKIQDIKVIKKEEIEKRRNCKRRTKIAMLKILLEEEFPDKVHLIFPQNKVGVW